jgi:hypothetical protein
MPAAISHAPRVTTISASSSANGVRFEADVMIRWSLGNRLAEYARSTSGAGSGDIAAAAASRTSAARPKPRQGGRPIDQACSSRRKKASVFDHASAAALAS